MSDIVKDRDETKKKIRPMTPAESHSQCPMQALNGSAEAALPEVDSSPNPTAARGGSGTSEPAKVPIRDEATSQNLAGNVELTVIADLKTGLINVRNTMTYATRLRILLRALNAIRKRRAEQPEESIFVSPMDVLQAIHHVSWTIIDNDRKMLMSVVFDRALEPYIRKLVDDAGPVLNTILCHCQGYHGHTGYAAFTDFVRRNQVPTEFLGATVPGLTVDDQRYLKALEQQLRGNSCPANRDLQAAKLHVAPPLDTTTELTDKVKSNSARQALQIIALMYRLDKYFPAPEELAPCDCTRVSLEALATADDAARDRAFFLSLIKSMLPRFDTAWVTEPLRQRFSSELAWFEQIVCALPEPKVAQAQRSNFEPSPVPLAEIQGNILAEYKHITHGCLLLLRLGTPELARRFLGTLQSQVTTGATTESDTTLNVALTCNGLKSLGLSDAELVKFPKEFREGMECRAGLLGDIGQNHPSQWSLPERNWPLDAGADAVDSVRLATVDLVIQLQKANVSAGDDKWLWCAEHPLFQEVAALAAQCEQHGGQLLSVQPLRRKLIDGNVHEHFGFRDGLSQPMPEASHDDLNRVTLGEILLGHANDRGDPVAQDHRDDVLRNGTFLVVRKLAQDVAAFEEFLDAHGNEIDLDLLAAKMVGRRTDGTPVGKGKDSGYNSHNNFDYSDDPDGLKCPLHAHVRRVNPRDGDIKQEPVPRIMRRGFAYGPRYEEDPDSDRGLMFMAYNASIAQQFEVVQRWISGGNSTGVLSAHSDPLLGVTASGQQRNMTIVHDGKVLRYNLGDKPFVKLEWGMYLFVPSIGGLQTLAASKVSAKPYPAANVRRGEELLQKFQTLDRIESNPDAVLRWKKLLEDRSSRKYAEDVWAAIRANTGVHRTPYGVLVADESRVLRVLEDNGENFSVREFYTRMEQTTGLLYLGIDENPQPLHNESQVDSQCPHHSADDYVAAMQPVGPDEVPRYRHESKSINPWIANFSQQEAFADARRQTNIWLKKCLRGDQVRQGEIQLQDLVRDVFGRLAAQWFGLPEDENLQIGGAPGAKPHCPDDFQLVASYVFNANPTPFVAAKARERGQAMRDTIKQYVSKMVAGEAPFPTNTLLGHLLATGAEVDTIVRTVAGVAVGFVSPTTGSFLSAVNTWIMSEDFWRHQQAYLERASTASDTYVTARDVLKSALIRAMQERPVPPLPYRTAVREVGLGDVIVKPGERVVLGLVSATLQQLEKPVANDEQATRMLFGGNYGDANKTATAHACPGQNMAFGTMLGILSALFELEGTLRPNGGLVLSVNE